MNRLLVENNSGDPIKIRIGDFVVGDKEKFIISGPCAIKDYESFREQASELKKLGVHALRGGIFKPRTSPYDFQGIQEEGLKILKEVNDEFNIPVSTEIMDTRDIDEAIKYIDVIQIGTRNMYNYSLLKEVGKTNMPVILKRGMSATIKEWLYSAEYILKEGNSNVILCERGIRSFESFTRNTLDLNAVAYIKEKYRLPIIVDPSHGTGLRELVHRMSLAGIAAGADGLLIESYVDPDKAISDARQTIDLHTLNDIIKNVESISKFI